jgi:hypothetical protein
MITLRKQDYWRAIVDYYYDNIHWEEEGPPSIYQWLKRDYDATCSLQSHWITFSDPAKHAWFVLRWGDYAEAREHS